MTQIVFRTGADLGKSVAIPEQGVTIGRNSASEVPIAEPSVSGQHGSIRFEHGNWWVHDNNSSNGTHVNDVQVQDSIIRHGDILKFGSVEAEFQSAPEAPSSAILAEAKPAVSEASKASASKAVPTPAKLPISKAPEKPALKLPPKAELKPGLKLPSSLSDFDEN